MNCHRRKIFREEGEFEKTTKLGPLKEGKRWWRSSIQSRDATGERKKEVQNTEKKNLSEGRPLPENKASILSKRHCVGREAGTSEKEDRERRELGAFCGRSEKPSIKDPKECFGEEPAKGKSIVNFREILLAR